ncbi:MAG: AAA family ATPase [Saprospiraceae bacterium]
MKISSIHLKDYLRFKDFPLDLTYPAGHEKAGEPLDKVCFIGQSGTGKTTILNLIRAIAAHGLIDKSYVMPSMKSITAETHLNTGAARHVQIQDGEISVAMDKKTWKTTRKMTSKDIERHLAHYKDSNILLSFPADITTNLDGIFVETQSSAGFGFPILKETKQEAETVSVQKPEDTLRLKFFDFDMKEVGKIWGNILKEVNEYKEAETRFNSGFAHQFSSQDGAVAPEMLVKKLTEEFNRWKAANPNPLGPLAEKLNTILNSFCLEIRPQFKFESADDLRFVKVYATNGGREVPHKFWSTGTKQLILTATPLVQLNTDKSIILMDEPERSFYPDIQQKLVGFYTQLAPQAQFFFSTHSPIIASAFDPWEIVELKFDEQGNIVQDQFFDGERAEENFRLHPKYLRWDSILTRVFDLENEGNPARAEKLQQLAELDVKLKRLKSNGQNRSDEAAQLWEAFKETADLLDWKITTYAQN